MKKILTGSLAIAAIVFFAACNNAPKDHEAKTEAAQEVSAASGDSISIDLDSSTIGWRGTHKANVKPPRVGIFKLSSGSISVKDGQVTGGNFVVDINSIQDHDLLPDTAQAHQLEGHLKSPDFFDAAKYPTAKFAITSIAPYDSAKVKSLIAGATNLVSGNLTFKDSTLNITFPAKIVINGDHVTVNAQFSFDRTTWGLNYKGPNNAQDWLIDKPVELTLNISTKAK